MTAFDPGPAAAALLKIRRARSLVEPLPVGIAPRTEEEGSVTQATLAALVNAARPAGFKIGATGKRMQEYLAACRTRDFRSITTAVRLRRLGHQTAGGAPITS